MAELPRPHVEALTTFGQRFGMAFQIVDDILDVVATEEELGKPAGNDLAEGVYTLPVIRALAGTENGAELAGFLGRPLTRPEVEQARALVQADGAVESALAVAGQYCDEAVATLAELEGAGVDDLAAAATSLLDLVPARRP